MRAHSLQKMRAHYAQRREGHVRADEKDSALLGRDVRVPLSTAIATNKAHNNPGMGGPWKDSPAKTVQNIQIAQYTYIVLYSNLYRDLSLKAKQACIGILQKDEIQMHYNNSITTTSGVIG